MGHVYRPGEWLRAGEDHCPSEFAEAPQAELLLAGEPILVESDETQPPPPFFRSRGPRLSILDEVEQRAYRAWCRVGYPIGGMAPLRLVALRTVLVERQKGR